MNNTKRLKFKRAIAKIPKDKLGRDDILSPELAKKLIKLKEKN